jgi:hypothetical protein
VACNWVILRTDQHPCVFQGPEALYPPLFKSLGTKWVCSTLVLASIYFSMLMLPQTYDLWWNGFFIIVSGVRLSPLGTAATTGLLYKPQMIDDGDCGETGGMKIGRGNRGTRRKPAPAPLCPPQIPHDQTRARTRAAALGSQWLTARAMARPCETGLLTRQKDACNSRSDQLVPNGEYAECYLHTFPTPSYEGSKAQECIFCAGGSQLTASFVVVLGTLIAVIRVRLAYFRR